MSGHSDVVMGVLATSNEKIAERIRFLQNGMHNFPQVIQLHFKTFLKDHLYPHNPCKSYSFFMFEEKLIFSGTTPHNVQSSSNENVFFFLALGPVPSPFDSYLANRGLKTLHIRMRQHGINAMAVARFLEKDPRSSKVVYPGRFILK